MRIVPPPPEPSPERRPLFSPVLLLWLLWWRLVRAFRRVLTLPARELAEREHRLGQEQPIAREVVDELAQSADGTLNGYTARSCGHGLLRLPDRASASS